MHNTLAEILVPPTFAVCIVGIVWLLHRKWPKLDNPHRIGDEVFLNALTYGEYKSVAVVRDEVTKATGDWIDPARVIAALERLLEDGKAKRRMSKRFVQTRTLETPEYKRVSDLRPEDMGIKPLRSSDIPRQWTSKR